VSPRYAAAPGHLFQGHRACPEQSAEKKKRTQRRKDAEAQKDEEEGCLLLFFPYFASLRLRASAFIPDLQADRGSAARFKGRCEGAPPSALCDLERGGPAQPTAGALPWIDVVISRMS
jgi:hypothetical protein